MNNKIVGVIVDAGHGNIDSGAVGIDGLEEKNLNLEASLYIYDRLNELGIPVKLTRDSDEYLPKEKRVARVLELYDNSPNVLLISNHINAGGAEGAEVIYSLKNNSTFADLILNNIGEKGQLKRKTYQRRLPENPNKDYYYILRETGNVEPVLIEYGFIDNQNDARKLKNNIKDYAEGVVKAITEYIGTEYIPPYNEKYIVKEGDTLYSISKKTNVPIDKIKEINSLSSNTIYKGQILYLNDNKQIKDTEIYIVQKNDTLYQIAKNNNISVEDLKKINNLSTNQIYIGDKLLVPKKSEIIEQDSEYDIYTVQKGDSLWQISNKYNISTKELIDINNLENLTLQIGQKLLVPKNTTSEEVYIVEKGDTLWSIAKKNNVSVDTLKRLNNLSNNLLSIGQHLIIKEKNL